MKRKSKSSFAFKRMIKELTSKVVSFIIILIVSLVLEYVFATNNEVFASVVLTFIIEILYINLYLTPINLRHKQKIIEGVKKLNNEHKRDKKEYVFNDVLFDMYSNYKESIIRLFFYSTINIPLIICASVEKIYQPLSESEELRVMFCLFGMFVMSLLCTGYATRFENKYINQQMAEKRSSLDSEIQKYLPNDSDVFIEVINHDSIQ